MFSRIYQKAAPNTMLGETGCLQVYRLVKQTAHLPGEMAEVGVYQGGMTKLMALSDQDKLVYAFDTFTGLPRPSSKDTHKEGEFKAELAVVEKYLSDCPNILVMPGVFPASAAIAETEIFSFVHVDCDLYQSVKDCCEFFWPRMVEGGMMLFDDYHCPSCPGAKEAVDEFFKDKAELTFPATQALVRKNADI
jgi:O-methyltransferase